ncbi:LOW QUALITY PROTEIN: hypothetical protein ACHAXR_001169 [Thalassiosira sp. AJA248-18]
MATNSIIRQAALAVAFAFFLSTPVAHSFVPSISSQTQSSPTTSTTSINIFGGLADAFSNDDSLGKAKNAGLSNGPKFNDQVTAKLYRKSYQVCASARVKVPYNCQNGECGTCTVNLNGRKVKACVSKVPSGKCAITTL